MNKTKRIEDANNLNNTLAKFKHKAKDKIFSSYSRRKIKNKNFTIISNNCVAGWIYRKIGLPYTTPTIGLFFFSEDYIKFLENFNYYISLPLKFINSSRHPEANEALKKKKYPVGLLGDEIEIQFIHSTTEDEVAEKWKRRTERIAFDNLFIIYSDRDDFHEEFLQRFEKLPFQHKIFFSSKPRKSKFVVFIRDFEKEAQVGPSYNREYEKYIDVIKWINGENIFLK